MSYSFFNARRRDFDDGEGGEVSLGEHLDYVDNFGGTPDCWDRTETDNRNSAMLEAKNSGLHLHVVCENTWRVVGTVNAPVY